MSADESAPASYKDSRQLLFFTCIHHASLVSFFDSQLAKHGKLNGYLYGRLRPDAGLSRPVRRPLFAVRSTRFNCPCERLLRSLAEFADLGAEQHEPDDKE